LHSELGIDLWSEPTWLKMVDPYVRYPDDSTEEEAVWDFRCAMEDGHYCRERCTFTYGDVDDNSMLEYRALRMLYEWLMLHRLDGLELLLDRDYAHVGIGLFPWAKHLSFESGCRQSLLGIAALDACSPEAVRMLLGRGANPDGMLNRKPCAIEGPECGAEAFAIHEMGALGHQTDAVETTSISILEALLEGGSEPIGPLCIYQHALDRKPPSETERGVQIKAAFEKRIALCLLHSKHRETRARQRFANVVAAVAIVSFWRHISSAPGAQGAKRASAGFHDAAKRQVIEKS
jgi:hypothetical protein